MDNVLRAPAATGLILAGGPSTRLGRDKALITVDGAPLLQRTAEALAVACEEIIIVGDMTGREDVRLPDGARWVADAEQGRGPLGGLQTGLDAASHDLTFAASCDMPLLNSWLVTILLRIMEEDAVGLYGAVVPRVNQVPQTLHAVYRKSCAHDAERLLREQERPGIQSLLRRLRVWYVEQARLATFDPDLRSMMNVNTQEDLERAESLLRGERM